MKKLLLLVLFLSLFATPCYADLLIPIIEVKEVKCPKDKPLLDRHNGSCHSCDSTDNLDVDEDVCSSVCKNRIYSNDVVFSGCVLKECPKDKPIFTDRGECFSCNTTDTIFLGWGEKRTVETQKIKNPCSRESISRPKPWWNDSVFNGIPDISEKPSLPKQKKITPSLCQNRTMLISFNERTNNNVYYSRLTTCPPDMPLRDHNGGCHSCDEKKEILQDKSTVFWGEIRCKKVYDESLNLLGIIEDDFIQKRASELTDEELYNTKIFIHNEKGEKIAYIKVGKDYNENSEFSSKRKSGLTWYKKDFGKSYEDILYLTIFIYNMENQIIAEGSTKISEDISQNKNAFEGTYYFSHTVLADKTCPNREIVLVPSSPNIYSSLKE